MRRRREHALACILSVALSGCGWLCPDDSLTEDSSKPVGLIQLIEFHDIQGLRNWGYELDQRGIPSLVFVQKNMLEAYPAEIKWLADQGHEVAGGYGEQAFWDVDYETQYQIMSQTKELVEQVTEKPMRVFGSRYFAYDESTLKSADALGVEYILARGTSDVEVLIYDPDEYNCKIVSVSNVTFEDMGRGSLCDYSLWARGSTAQEFGEILTESIAKNPERIMIASHAYLGGMKKEWWEAYRNMLDSGTVRWATSFDEWVSPDNGVNLELPMSLIPINREVMYETPTPAIPLDESDEVDQMHNPCGVP